MSLLSSRHCRCHLSTMLCVTNSWLVISAMSTNPLCIGILLSFSIYHCYWHYKIYQKFVCILGCSNVDLNNRASLSTAILTTFVHLRSSLLSPTTDGFPLQPLKGSYNMARTDGDARHVMDRSMSTWLLSIWSTVFYLSIIALMPFLWSQNSGRVWGRPKHPPLLN